MLLPCCFDLANQFAIDGIRIPEFCCRADATTRPLLKDHATVIAAAQSVQTRQASTLDEGPRHPARAVILDPHADV